MQSETSACAIIPARGGSKGVRRKNLREVGGVSLVERAIRSLQQVPQLSHIVVTTDDAEIAAVAERAGALVVIRPAALADDAATSEAAVFHALDALRVATIEPAITVLVQATSPFIRPEDVSAAIDRVASGDEDVVFSAFETYAFLWKHSPNGMIGVNHDHTFRPRRQDREPHFQETGAFYAMRTAGFQAAGFRFFGTVGVQSVPESTAIEIDSVADLSLATRLAEASTGSDHDDAPRVQLEPIDVDALVTDFDGVHTDDTVAVDEHGVESVTVSRSDGMGVSLLRHAGVRVLILSTERNEVVARRAEKLQVDVIHGSADKASALASWITREHLDPARVAYVGNDVNDLGCFSLVGWPIAVSGAHDSVRSNARIVLTTSGGHGAVREIADRILVARKETVS